MDKRKVVCGWAINHGTTSCAECFDKRECMVLSALQEARALIEKACITSEDGSPVKYGEYDGGGNYMLPETLPNIPKLEAILEVAQKKLRECPTCGGDGIMAAVVGFRVPHDEEILEDHECEECHGTGVSSWGQAIDKAERLEKENAELREAVADLKAGIRSRLESIAFAAPEMIQLHLDEIEALVSDPVPTSAETEEDS